MDVVSIRLKMGPCAIGHDLTLDLTSTQSVFGMHYTTLYRPATALGLRISACNAAADASISSRLISRTACSTCGDDVRQPI